MGKGWVGRKTLNVCSGFGIIWTLKEDCKLTRAYSAACQGSAECQRREYFQRKDLTTKIIEGEITFHFLSATTVKIKLISHRVL